MDEKLARVHELGLAAGDFIVAGSGILQALGIRESRDLDILVRKIWLDEFAQKCKKCQKLREPEKAYQLGRHDDGTRAIFVGEIELMDDWFGEDFDAILPLTVKINGVNFLPLDKVLAYKKMLARPKDLGDIARIEEYLRQKKSA